jgi:hypothetical protein
LSICSCTCSLLRPQEPACETPPLSANAGARLIASITTITATAVSNNRMRMNKRILLLERAGLVSPAVLYNERSLLPSGGDVYAPEHKVS